MIDLGLDTAGWERLRWMLTYGYNLRIVLNLIDLNHKHLDSLSWRFQDGQVTVSSDAEITRSASLVLWDPDKSLRLDDVNPDLGGLYSDKMIQIFYCVWQDGDTRSIDIPVFTGPVYKAKRSGAFLNVDLLGKEFLSQTVIWTPQTYYEGANRGRVIKDIMRRGSGEQRMTFAETGYKLAANLSLGREAMSWEESKKIIKSMNNKHLFYDGRGTLRFREYPSRPTYVYSDGPGGSLTSDPELTYNLDNAKNLIWVVGATGISAVARAPSSHPLNHNRIGRVYAGTLVPRYLMEKIENSNISSNTAAQALADKMLDARLKEALEFTGSAVPIPFLEEMDIVGVQKQNEYMIQVRNKEFTIPLVAGTEASIGSTKNLALKRRV